MKTGTIKSFNHNTGDGMITPSNFSQDVYFSKSVVEGGTAWVSTGVAVKYALYDGEGTPEAKMVCKS